MDAVDTPVVGLLLKPNAGADVVGAFEPNANEGALALVVEVLRVVDGAGAVVFAVAPNENMDGVPVPDAELAVVLVPNPTPVFAASVGFVAGLPKLNVSGAVDTTAFVAGLANAFAPPNENEGIVLPLLVDCGNPKDIVGVDFSAVLFKIGEFSVDAVGLATVGNVNDVGVDEKQNPPSRGTESLDVDAG